MQRLFNFYFKNIDEVCPVIIVTNQIGKPTWNQTGRLEQIHQELLTQQQTELTGEKLRIPISPLSLVFHLKKMNKFPKDPADEDGDDFDVIFFGVKF
mmetsp:Transcript_23565/g.36387  ORF Transcript_23565/g.36387 Transcript_23565/m.36387 type:complete len:97 (-) Transcript_23565:126-416(-)